MNLSNLDLSQNPLISFLILNDNNLSEIDVTNNPLIEQLYIRNNQISIIDLSQNPVLRVLGVNNNPLTSLDVAANPNLQGIDFSNTNIYAMDLSNNPSLCAVEGNDIDWLHYVNIKNGNNIELINANCYNGELIDSGLNLSNNPNLEFVCVDNVNFAISNFTNVSSTATFIEDCLLAVNNFESLEVNLYPNPSDGILNIQAESSISSIEIMNVLGQLLLTSKGNSTHEQMDISGLSAGNYFVRVVVGSESGVLRVVIK
jgi:hypothetical protein